MSGVRSRQELWIAIHAALDARNDPWADESVTGWLAEHPEDLEAVLRLQEGLRVLARPQRRRARPLVAAASIVAAALAIVLWLRGGSGAAAPRSEVLAYRLSVSTETPTTRVTTTLDNGSIVREHETRLVGSGGSLPIATLSMTTIRKGLR